MKKTIGLLTGLIVATNFAYSSESSVAHNEVKRWAWEHTAWSMSPQSVNHYIVKKTFNPQVKVDECDPRKAETVKHCTMLKAYDLKIGSYKYDGTFIFGKNKLCEIVFDRNNDSDSIKAPLNDDLYLSYEELGYVAETNETTTVDGSIFDLISTIEQEYGSPETVKASSVKWESKYSNIEVVNSDVGTRLIYTPK